MANRYLCKSVIMNNKYQNTYRIPTCRVSWHGYDGGVYFITICTAGHVHYFGEIIGKGIVETSHCDVSTGKLPIGETSVSGTSACETPRCDVSTGAEPCMQLSEIGRYTDVCVHKMETLHYDIQVPLYQIMPNHIHLIVIVRTPVVETSHCGVSQEKFSQDKIFHDKISSEKTAGTQVHPQENGKNKKMRRIAGHCGRLSHVISHFKAAVTSFARENRIDFAWQTRFHDHIVLDQNELNLIAEYIENNVANWQSDRMNI